MPPASPFGSTDADDEAEAAPARPFYARDGVLEHDAVLRLEDTTAILTPTERAFRSSSTADPYTRTPSCSSKSRKWELDDDGVGHRRENGPFAAGVHADGIALTTPNDS